MLVILILVVPIGYGVEDILNMHANYWRMVLPLLVAVYWTPAVL